MSFLSKINWRIILQILGFLLIIEGLFMFTGIPFSIYYCNYKCLSLLYSGLITLSTGGVIWFITRKANRAIGKRGVHALLEPAAEFGQRLLGGVVYVGRLGPGNVSLGFNHGDAV